MQRRAKAKWWGAAFLALVLFLWAFSDILAPFLFGAVIAYFADPVADKLESLGLSRTVATLIITAIAVIIAMLALIVLLPLLFDQTLRFVSNAPQYFEKIQTFAEGVLSSALPSLAPSDGKWFSDEPGELSEQAKMFSMSALKGILSGGLAIVDLLGVFLITPIVAFYLLLDWSRLLKAIDSLLPRKHADTIREIAHDIDDVISGFLRGQFSVCLILGSFYAVALTVVGLDFGLLVGIFAGLISFIPFLGSITGLILSVGLAIAQSWGEWWWIGLVAAIFIVGQLVEGNVLTPLLVGGQVGLHPVMLIFALSAFGYAFGFAGLLLAVPVAAAIGVLARWALKQYQQSELYTGVSD